MIHLLARQASNGREGAANVLPLYDSGAMSSPGHCQGEVLARFSASDDKDIVAFDLAHVSTSLIDLA
jgi:hypothetical protein